MGGVAFLVLLVTVCGTACGSKRADDRAPPAQRAATTTPPRPPELTEGMGLRLRGTVAPSRHVTIATSNAGSEVVRLESQLRVERMDDGEWEEVDGVHGLLLRADCQAPQAECVSLVPGAELYPPEWLGMLGDAQCVCTGCGPAPAGTYRFVAHSCEGDRVYRGEPFVLD